MNSISTNNRLTSALLTIKKHISIVRAYLGLLYHHLVMAHTNACSKLCSLTENNIAKLQDTWKNDYALCNNKDCCRCYSPC